jgi:hypothetical protein
MSKTQCLRPAAGVKVRRPDGKHLAEAGETVTMNSYWDRRLTAGDVVVGAPAKAAAKVAGDGRDKGKRE